MHNIKFLFGRLFLPSMLLVSSFHLSAQPLNTPLPLDSHVIKGKFANGLTYYIRPNSKPEKKVQLRLVVNAGSILENNDQQGLAHFMEHMNFNGTRHFQKNELVSYLQSIGVEFGADLNAATSFDETVYELPIPTDKPDNLEKGFQILEDWAHNALLTSKDIDDERKVVLEESRLGKGADQRMMEKYLPVMLKNSRYAERLPIGKDTILKTFNYDKIRSFYHDWYRPDLQAVIVVGDVDTTTAMQLIRKHFEHLQNPVNEKKRFTAGVNNWDKPNGLVVTDKEATSYGVQIIFPSQKKDADITLGDYKESIERNLAIQMLNTRLSDLARGDNPPFPLAFAGFDGWARGYENFMAIAAFGSEGPQKALSALTAELARVRTYGFTEQELELAKKDVQSRLDRLYKERKTTESGNYIEEYVRNFLENEPIPGIENEYEYHKELLPQIKLADLNKMAREWVSSPNFFSLITGPDKKDVKLPSGSELTAMVVTGLNQNVTAYKSQKVSNVLMSKLLEGGKIVGETREADLDATTYTLSNGIKVTVKPTTYKTDEIIVQGIKKGGSNNYGLADKYNTQFATHIVAAMGVGDYTPTELEKVLAGVNVRVSAGISNIQDIVTGNSTVNDVEKMFQLMYLRMMQPRRDTQLFNAFCAKEKTQLQFATANPQTSFIDTSFSILYNRNPLANSPVTKPGDIDSINLDRALEIYRDEFADADGYHFFIVGNVDTNKILPLVERYLGSIPAKNLVAAYKDNGVRPINGIQKITVKRGKEKQSLIFSLYTGELPYTEDFDLRAQALAEVMNIKVIEILREKMGGIYTGGCFASVAKEPYAHYTFGMQFPCGPENVDKLIAAANDEINAIKQKGPDAADLDKVKKQWHEKHRTDVESNSYWTSQLEQALFWGKDKNHILDYDQWIDTVTPADVQQTAKAMFNGKNEFTTILYPESLN